MTPAKKENVLRDSVLLILLATVCIGFVELAVCRFEEPQLYEEVTAPVASAAAWMRDRAVCGWNWSVRQATVLQQTARREASLCRESLAEAGRCIAERLTPPPEAEAAETEAVPVRSAPYAFKSAVTEFQITRRGELLTGGLTPVVYYNQKDQQWAGCLYGKDSLRGFGCGPTALAMAVSTLTGTNVDPAEMAEQAARMGYWASRHGSELSIVPGIAEYYALGCEPLDPKDADALAARLASGGVAVALMGPGDFASKGHFILIHAVTAEGKWLVADSASRGNSLTAWEPQVILDQLSASRHSGAPLWFLTAPGNR